jgi:excisionase family DNA binding protein
MSAVESFVTVKEAAEILGLSDGRVRDLLGTGQLPGTKRGGAWFIRRRDVFAFKALPEGKAGRPRELKRRH